MCGRGGLGGIKEGLEGGESAFCACMFHLAPPPFFPLPGQFEFEVNRDFFFFLLEAFES